MFQLLCLQTLNCSAGLSAMNPDLMTYAVHVDLGNLRQAVMMKNTVTGS